MAAMKDAVGKLKMSENGQQAIASIEKNLGLDKLGVTLNDVVDSLTSNESGKKLMDALEKGAGMKEDTAKADRASVLKIDDIGLYRTASF